MELKDILVQPEALFLVGRLWFFGSDDKLMGPVLADFTIYQ